VFVVQLWKLVDLDGSGRFRSIQPHENAITRLTNASADGHRFFVIPSVNTAKFNRLPLIITRIDARESSDPIGQYTIVLCAGADSDGDGALD